MEARIPLQKLMVQAEESRSLMNRASGTTNITPKNVISNPFECTFN